VKRWCCGILDSDSAKMGIECGWAYEEDAEADVSEAPFPSLKE